MAQFVLPGKNDYQGDSSTDKEYPLIPEYTRLHCEVIGVEEKEKRVEHRYDPEVPETEISFKFKVLDGEYANQWLFGNTRAIFNWDPKCKFRHWVEAILGVTKDGLPEGYELDLPALTGMKVDIIAGVRIRKYDQKEVNLVKDVLPSAPAPGAVETFG